MARSARGLRPVVNQPTARRALVSARCELGAVVCAANSQRALPHAVGRGSSAQTPRFVGGCGFGPSLTSRFRPVACDARALRHVENQPTTHRALVTACCVLGAVVCAANSRRAPPHAVGRGSSAQKPRLVGSCGFEPSFPVSFSSRGALRARALRPVENPPTARRALVSARCVLGAGVCAANSRRAPPHPVGRGSSAQTPRFVGGCGFKTSLPSRFRLVACDAGALRHAENQPTAHRARVSARCVLGAVVCAANSQRALPHAVTRGSWLRHRALSAAVASDRR